MTIDSDSNPILSSRIQGAFYGLAVCDALGGPCEFHARGTFCKITTLLPNKNFGLPAGCFTDDTSQALCLAASLLINKGQNNAVDQISRYIRWRSEGYMSSTGECFDIGLSTSRVLSDWKVLLSAVSVDGHTVANGGGGGGDIDATLLSKVESQVQTKYDHEQYCGNGSLMRVLPVALLAETEDQAVKLARESSKTTHPHLRCQDACEIYVRLVFRALHQPKATKEDLALYLTKILNSSPASSTTSKANGSAYDSVLLERLVPYTRTHCDIPTCVWLNRQAEEIKATGYVVDTLEASLWSFFSTDSFRDGAVTAVNLGDDADTVGAIYGGLAGAFYGLDAIPNEWISGMTERGMKILRQVVHDILKHHELDIPDSRLQGITEEQS